jgi:hypothetical protein
MTSQQLELIARRGLTLPEPTLTRLRTVGIWCEANLTLQRRDQDWLIRGQESGGAVNDIGCYIGFCKEDGSALSWLQPLKNFMPNGLHAVLLAPGPIVRLDMYRFETSYDLLITSHTLAPEEGKPKPKLETRLIFFHRFDNIRWGTLHVLHRASSLSGIVCHRRAGCAMGRFLAQSNPGKLRLPTAEARLRRSRLAHCHCEEVGRNDSPRFAAAGAKLSDDGQ